MAASRLFSGQVRLNAGMAVGDDIVHVVLKMGQGLLRGEVGEGLGQAARDLQAVFFARAGRAHGLHSHQEARIGFRVFFAGGKEQKAGQQAKLQESEWGMSEHGWRVAQ